MPLAPWTSVQLCSSSVCQIPYSGLAVFALRKVWDGRRKKISTLCHMNAPLPLFNQRRGNIPFQACRFIYTVTTSGWIRKRKEKASQVVYHWQRLVSLKRLSVTPTSSRLHKRKATECVAAVRMGKSCTSAAIMSSLQLTIVIRYCRPLSPAPDGCRVRLMQSDAYAYTA